MPPAPQTPPDGSDGPRLTPRVVLFRIIGVVAVGLAAIGAVLPLMPTTVFLLIALWAFARGSPALADRLRNHSRFGPMIRDWEERGAIPVKAKATAVAAMAVSWTVLALTSDSRLAPALVAVLLVCVAAWIVTRPSA